MRMLLSLFMTFARIGVSTFGGGYAMLPLLQRDVADKHRWLTDKELADCYAMSQCLPGLIAVNFATYVGFRQKKIAGAFAATLGVILPSVIIITVISIFVSSFSQLAIVKNAFAGVRVCVCVLIINSVVKLWKTAVTDKLAVMICLTVFLITVMTKLSAVVLVIAAGIVGVCSTGKKAAI